MFGHGLARHLETATNLAEALAVPDVKTVQQLPAVGGAIILGHGFAVGRGRRSVTSAESDSMATPVATHLMFQEGKAQDAMTLYGSVFPDFRVVRIERYASGEPGPVGTVKRADVDFNGHRLVVIDSPITHGFTFTPSVSLFVDCTSAVELDTAFGKLAEGGRVYMPLGNYGFSPRFGWCSDRFGVSWQLNLPSAPTA